MSMQVEVATGQGAAPGVQRPRRAPREAEIALMRQLASGPKAMTSGPIGRCVKRGWCRAVMTATADAARSGPLVVFALTDSGRTLLAQR